ncbi:MAG: SpoIIE family protein phosphatase [Candidatus Latescibacterota bacterium]
MNTTTDHSGPIRILVVDDEPDLELLIRQKFRREIRDREMDFKFASDGMKALEQVQGNGQLDIVLSDINMPRMDGLTLLSRLSEIETSAKTVIVSAYGDMDNIRTAMNRGAFDFVTKPINFEDLKTTVDKTYREVLLIRRAEDSRRHLELLQKELDIANRIQLSTLPSDFPAFPEHEEFDLYATMIPAQEVGGDFYDFFLINDEQIGFVVGDVSGKGVGAAMFMAITKTLLKATAVQGLPANACMRHVNRVLYPESVRGLFVTAFYGILDKETGQLSYCCAGHNHPYVRRADGNIEKVDPPTGLAICLKDDFHYKGGQVQLESGDSLFVYTDGVNEAINRDREEFGVENIQQCLRDAASGKPVEIVRDVLREVERFSGGIDQNDDITILTLQYLG